MSNCRVMSPSTCVLSERAKIGAGAVIFPNNAVLGESEVGAGAMLYPNNILEDAAVGAGCRVTASVLREASVGENTSVGPFAHLRPGAKVGRGCRVGNFVEIKNAEIGDGTKIGHLTYVGDAVIGKNCNIGCGVVFCNYDGKNKHRTTVGDNCFIGSNVNLVAPVTLGDGCYIAAGATVTEDVPAGAFVIGRVRPTCKERR